LSSTTSPNQSTATKENKSILKKVAII